MKKRFTEEQIIRVLKEHGAGGKTADVTVDLNRWKAYRYRPYQLLQNRAP